MAETSGKAPVNSFVLAWKTVISVSFSIKLVSLRSPLRFAYRTKCEHVLLCRMSSRNLTLLRLTAATASTPSGLFSQVIPLNLHGLVPTHVFMIPLGSDVTVFAKAVRVAASLAKLDGPGARLMECLLYVAEASARREERTVRYFILNEWLMIKKN